MRHTIRIPSRRTAGAATLALLLGLAGWHGAGWAQTPPDAGKSTGMADDARTPASPAGTGEPDTAPTDAGIPLGGFLLYPDATVRGGYDDNLFAAPDDEEDDTLLLFSPTLGLESDWSRHRLAARTGARVARHHIFENEDYEDYWAEADGRYDVSEAVNLFGGAGWSRGHEERFSPDDVDGKEPTTFDNATAHLGGEAGLGPFSARLGGTVSKLDFDDVPTTNGRINNDDRDRRQHAVGVRGNVEVRPGTTLFLQAARDVRSYDASVDDLGVDRDSAGKRLAAGAEFEFRGGRAEILAGRLDQNYEDSRLQDVDAFDIGARLRWWATPLTRLSASVDRTLEETTVFDPATGTPASSYLNTAYTVGFDRRLTPNLAADAYVSYGDSDYQGIDRRDEIVYAGLGMQYRMTRHLVLEADYDFRHRDSSVESADYFRNRVLLGIRAMLYPLPPRHSPTLAEAVVAAIRPTPDFDGFYMGMQIGHGALATHTEGARGSGTDDGDFGDLGTVAGPFIGYGIGGKRFHAGVELEAEVGGEEWRHAKTPDGRVFSHERGDGFGAGLRLGWIAGHQSLLYTRFGYARGEFETYYKEDDATPAVEQTDRLDGLRYGLGLEIPVNDETFWRFDYSITDYEDFDIATGSDVETFDNRETLFRIGFGWRAGEHWPGAAPSRRQSPDGFYAGAAVGYGLLVTDLDAVHRQPHPPSPTQLDAPFAAQGYSAGYFAGYGISLESLYLGVELEDDSGSSDWRHVRDPGGRDFGVRKKGGRGASVRVGWAFQDGTLVYVRRGKIQTKFDTEYVKGNNPDNWVDRQDKIDGDRVALGAEMPLLAHLFLRMEYSHTDYDSYGFTTAHSQTDEVAFDNAETLFRLGLGLRF